MTHHLNAFRASSYFCFLSLGDVFKKTSLRQSTIITGIYPASVAHKKCHISRAIHMSPTKAIQPNSHQGMDMKKKMECLTVILFGVKFPPEQRSECFIYFLSPCIGTNFILVWKVRTWPCPPLSPILGVCREWISCLEGQMASQSWPHLGAIVTAAFLLTPQGLMRRPPELKA